MISPDSKRDFEKIGSAILRYIEQLCSRSQMLSEHRVLLVGPLPESVEEAFLTRWRALPNRPVCKRAFRAASELEHWRSRFEPLAIGIEPVLITIGEDPLLPTAGFDLVATLEADLEISLCVTKGLKWLLKRNGTILVATKAEAVSGVKRWLERAGFQQIVARSDGQMKEPVEVDCVIARSDGRIKASTTVSSKPADPKPANGSAAVNRIPAPAQAAARIAQTPNSNVHSREAIRKLVINLIDKLLQLPPGVLDTSSPFTEFGIDSIGGVVLVNELNRRLSLELKPTVLFDYANVEKLTTYISDQCGPVLEGVAATGETELDASQDRNPPLPQRVEGLKPVPKPVTSFVETVSKTDVAIIGMSGRFPGAENTGQFWENLLAGKNSISEVPAGRWGTEPVPVNSSSPNSSRRGGFLSGATEFDPLFFNISGREAEVTDPQQRLFLEEAYHALEDAGYAGQSAQLAKKCGVFVGVEPGDYLHILMELGDRVQNASVFQGNAESILAARIAYFLDLKGPSIAINTACSSSLVSIHLACQSLTNGECDLALAGGVRVLASDKAFRALGNMGMLSPDSQCKTFDESADGFVPGEAVGILVLKPLQTAWRDRDHIYGVIKGSAINQDGRTNGITAPSSLSQTQVELETYERFGLNPETFQYVEAHGTGTKLGDPIEVEALTAAFKKFTSNKSFCGIGSVKTNIGHTMAAAGVCSIIKVLLSLRHSKIPPSLNLRKTNPYIDFEGSPFFANVTTRDWPMVAGRPRRAAVSSFGFSGTNSHLVLEEAPLQESPNREGLKPAYLVTVSAKSAEALDCQLVRLREWLESEGETADLEKVSFTLNAGRGHFEHRSAFVVSSIGELREALNAGSKGEHGSNAWRSVANRSDQADDVIFRQLAAELIKQLPNTARQDERTYREKLSALAALYVKGYDFDLALLHAGENHQRIPLPGYPFARERYWITLPAQSTTPENRRLQPGNEWVHPFLHRESRIGDQSEFVSSFTGSEFFFNEHQIRGIKILPGVAYLEMAIAATRQVTAESQLTLKNIAWLRPLTADQAGRVSVRLNRNGSEVSFAVRSADGELPHAEGKIICGAGLSERRENVSDIRARCRQTEDVDLIYARCSAAGLKLGPIFRTIREIWFAEDEALARLELPPEAQTADAEFWLHPGLLDGALQTISVLSQRQGLGLPVPFAVQEVRSGNLRNSCYAHVRRGVAGNDLLRFDILLLDDLGQVQVELTGLTMRAFVAESPAKDDQIVYVRPAWQKAPVQEIEAGLNGRLLLFDQFGDELANRIRQLCPGITVVVVSPGTSFERLESGFRVQPNSVGDYQRLVESAPPDFVIYRWAVDTADIEAALEHCILPLFQLVRALCLQGINHPVLLQVPYPCDKNPAYAAIAGYARTLTQERPNLRLKLVESVVPDAIEIVRELRSPNRDPEIRYCEGERQVKRLEIFTPEPVTTLPIREGGVYVITGGLGGLGRIFSRYLAELYRARLILIGRSAATPEGQAFLTELKSLGAEAVYLRADVADPTELDAALAMGRSKFGRIQGVIHAAGLIQDGFILKKEDFVAVMKPKVNGALALDRLTARDPLDFFAMFSSIAGVFGSVGQSDYAYANRFVDEFALHRERQRTSDARSGVTVSIAWPFWRNGGMRLNAEVEIRKLSQFGLTALEDKQGLSIFATALQAGEPQIVGLVGRTQSVKALVAAEGEPAISLEKPAVSASDAEATSRLREVTLRYLSRAFSELVKIPENKIRGADPFDKFGIDSIMVMEFTRILEKDFADLPATLLFEHRNLTDLTAYFVSAHAARLQQLFSVNGEEVEGREPIKPPGLDLSIEAAPAPASFKEPMREESGDIAIVGVFGRYPMADDLEEFWANLRCGRDCIVEIPAERWDYRIFYDPEPGKFGKTRNKWGGFMNAVDRFDARFFNVTPREAFALDPQERLFLETAWRTVEDAGYRKSALAGKKVGVFVGVMYGQYQLYGAGDVDSGNVFPLSSFYSSIANRVSYFFDWRGPSMAIDTMCSSSLTAIHLACQSLRRQESELALAGGVNTTLHPHKDMLMAPGGFAASDGRCRSFGEGGDGYVPGEGVGAVLLKPLAQAIKDKDHIYAIVKASSLNHGGKTNGYTVPNPNAQADLVLEAFTAARVDPRSINYFEAHGTGTALGDPIEIAGMTRAFREGAGASLESHRCAVGSVKSNIGHLESAAGIAGLTKVVLQMQHGEIVPSLHSTRLNPNIRFAESNFYVPQQIEPWKPAAVRNDRPVRRAGISSFGAGGANAHILIEEFVDSEARILDWHNTPTIFVLSAKTEGRLRAKAEQLSAYLSRIGRDRVSPREVAYTLQTGREPFDQRLAIVAKDLSEVSACLQAFLLGSEIEGVFHGSVRDDQEGVQPLLDGEEGELFLEALIRQQKWSKLAQFWVSGGEVNWERFYLDITARRVPLPTYPFAGERYWAPDQLKAPAKQSGTPPSSPIRNQANGTTPENSLPPESAELIFLRPRWQECSEPGESLIPSQGNLLLFDREDTLQVDIQSRHPGWSITRVIPGRGYSRGEGFVAIDPGCADDFQRLVATAKPDFVLHRWIDANHTLDDVVRGGVFTLFHLCQALIRSPLRSAIKVVVCDREDSDPAITALSGFARALAQEQPQLQLRVVQSNQIDAGVLGELFAEEEQRQIRWTGGRREVSRLEVFEPKTGDPVPLRRSGVYLITGGLGGLGQIFARRLAKDFGARLILTGRSALTEQGQSIILELEQLGSDVQYLQCDIGSIDAAGQLVRLARERFGGLNGILHTAGVLRDGFLLRKSFTEFTDVLRAKVYGTMLLDEATREERLDFFALFSSTAGAFGNVGQVDYSYANAFLDAFASRRERQRIEGRRNGRTVSIGWPLWKEKGMAQRAAQAARHLEQIGLHPLPEEIGYRIFEIALGTSEAQILPLYGLRQKTDRWLFGAQTTNGATESTPLSQSDRAQLLEGTEVYLKSILAEVTQLPVDQLDSHQRFEEFGVDSIVVGDFNLRLDRDLGPLPKTLLFEHANFRQLSRHLVEAFGSRLSRFLADGRESGEVDYNSAEKSNQEKGHHKDGATLAAGFDSSEPSRVNSDDVAIIGLAGRYPKADDVRAFWKALRSGADCVTEIPKSRWDIDQFFDPDPEKATEGKMYGRWGAFLDEVDKFDSLFFNIAPVEAELIDPQERLFLETAWSVLEDAGYTRLNLARTVHSGYAANVGVFVGITSNDYAALAHEYGHGRGIPTTLPWSIANRVSYLFNFNGPSMPVDTACSSSLTAIHLACEAIRRGECQQAIAGGVNLYLHPSRYVNLCLAKMLSTDGKCRALGEGGDGFVPGEGVGAVFLKPLSLAVADGDHIYGVIKGTAVNHGGRTNGYTVPNPAAQAELVKRALQQAKIDPRTVSYIEAHGTGTALGDPIELAALNKAFNEASQKPLLAGTCGVGSVKTNIGHLESAAGIAGLTKVLLQFKARELVPSLHAEKINPNITLDGTPFRLQRGLESWAPVTVDDKMWPRRAGISSFGAGGANAHLIVEEFVSSPLPQGTAGEAPLLILLSARSEESLRDYAMRLARFLRESPPEETPIESVAYTLQVGRESFEHRLFFVVGIRDELITKLEQVAAGDLANFVQGRVRRERVQFGAEFDEPDLTVATAWQDGDPWALGKLWVSGATIDGNALWGQTPAARRISLPTYAFRPERHWMDVSGSAKSDESDGKPEPLLRKRNDSAQNVWIYDGAFRGDEIVLRDHQIGKDKILPGAASLDLAMSVATEVLANANIRLRNVVWLRPLICGPTGLKISLSVRHDTPDRLAFDVLGSDGQLAMQGKAERIAGSTSEKLDLAELRKRCELSISADELYQGFAARGLNYGPGFRVLHNVRYGASEVLAELRVPEVWRDENQRVQPVLIDGALQSLSALAAQEGEARIPFALDGLQCAVTLPESCYAYSQFQGEGASVRFEIWLLDESGYVLGRLSGLRMRQIEPLRKEIVVCRPIWVPEPLAKRADFSGKILLFDDNAKLTPRLEERGSQVIRVTFSDQPPLCEHEVWLRPGDWGAYDRLVTSSDFDAIIHAWSAEGPGFAEQLERGPLSVHRLAKALIGAKKVVPWLFVHPTGQPVYEAVAGYAKSLRQEHPKLHIKSIGIGDTEEVDLLAELTQRQFEVRYQDDLREVRKLDQSLRLSPAADSGLKPGGVYLITGGAGGLGRIFASYLLDNFAARLVLAGRSELPGNWSEKLETSTVYIQADVSTLEGARKAVSEAKRRFGALHGIIHAAGELLDGLIRTKPEEDFLTVMRAKVQGAEALDEVTRDEPLDLFILFSSTAALLGNAGQSDYAYANAYLDAFAWRREKLCLAGQRSGHTVSINWPLWKEGGMQAGAETVRLQADSAGLSPLETGDGVTLFQQIAASRESQCAVLCGSPSRLLSRLNAPPDHAETPAEAPAGESGGVASRVELLEKLRELVGKVLRLDPHVIEDDADTSEYGFDSVTFTTLANEINTVLGLETTPAILFEFTTLEKLADFLTQEYGDKFLKAKQSSELQSPPAGRADLEEERGASVHGALTSQFNRASPGLVAAPGLGATVVKGPVSEPSRETESVRTHSRSVGAPLESGMQAIAVVGMSGIFPGSPNLRSYWKHLEDGEDLISKPPPGRWNFPATAFRGNGPEGAMDPPWGGFMPDVDQFDPLFFDISPREAELMDPQQRLFLQTVWHTLEDAGYSKSRLAGSKTGVFVGVAANDYASLLAMAGIPVEAYSSTGNAHSVLANRVSFFFDWHGPSEAIDTACSSSLVAIHRAIESIASGSCNLAIAGGVNVLLSPAAFVAFGKAGMLCADGRCKAFDADANGYVRGEGVGAILLKPLEKALRDSDHIYGIIRASAENHGGHVQGLTVPNPNAQSDLLKDAFERAGIDPFTIGYIEAHGTGTSLGDPIEVNGLKKAFGQNSGAVRDPRCAIASVKSNIGHLETAAGIAGIIKALLAMRHRRIPGNIHLKRLNPYIRVDGTPFYFPEKTVTWEPLIDQENRTLPRRAGVSSFGFGGANAHVVLEEFTAGPATESAGDERPQLVILSARNSGRLRELVSNFLEYLHTLRSEANSFLRPSLSQIAFTLQVGREPLAERLAIIASDLEKLVWQLEKFEQAESFDGLTGNIDSNKAGLQLLREVHQDDDYLDPLVRGRELRKLARLWVGGVKVPWEKLWLGNEAWRVPLPGYPFEQQRFWVPKTDPISQAGEALESRLHPLLHRNESTLRSHVYRSEFNGHEIFFRDHRVVGREVLPGAASLELALAGASLALETSNVALCRVVWLRPVTGESGPVRLDLVLRLDAKDVVRFELKNSDTEVCVSGVAQVVSPDLGEDLDLAAIRSRCKREISTKRLYEAFADRGLDYGDGFRVIEEISYSDSEALSKLQIPSIWGNQSFRLHPALLDGAFQSLATIESSSESGTRLPFAVDQVICPEPLPARCWAFVQLQLSDNGERRHTIKLANEEGRILASISGLSCRRLGVDHQTDPFYYRPAWKESELVSTEKTEHEGPWLVFDREGSANNLVPKGIETIRICAGDNYGVLGRNVTIRIENDADYERLVRDFEFVAVIHGWVHPMTGVAGASQSGVLSIHRLVQALLRAKKRAPIAFVYPIGIPAFEAVGGYGKTLRQEHPDLLLKAIGKGADLIDLGSELQNADLEVRYLDGRREIRTLEPVRGDLTEASPLKSGGIYLISGGGGGLGRTFARYFVERYDARVVLVGRSSQDESIREAVRLLGRNAVYLSADISTLEGARQAVEQAKDCYGAINGVLHAAGVLRDGLIWSKTSDDFWAVLRPKAGGAEALDLATSQEQLDWFVLFSSMAGLLGNAGQSDYAYANAYLDAFAYQREELRRRGERTGQTLSINWPVWRDGGMRATSEPGPDAGLGLRPLEREQGLEIFDRALAAKLTQVWAGIGDREKIESLRFGPKRYRRSRAGQAVRRAANQHSELVNHLISQLAGLLKLDETQIKPSELLESYGFDSIVAVEFSQLLEKNFGELSKTLLFEYPTIELLANYLLERSPDSHLTSDPDERSDSAAIDGSTEARAVAAGAAPPTNRSARSLELAPTDYPFVGPGRLAIQVLYHFENRLDFERLRAGLERAAKSFYPINSELVQAGDRAYIIRESVDPPDFAEINFTEEVELPEQDKPASFQQFCASFNPLLTGEKLAKFRLVQLKSGSLLSVNVSHAIADGYSYYYFLSAWAAACRGENFQEPVHSRVLIQDMAKAFLKAETNNLFDNEIELSPGPIDPTTERTETIRIYPEGLLAEARNSVEVGARSWLTENSVIAALVWQTYARAIGATGELALACPIDFRRMIPQLSPAFFGNASAPAILRLPNEEVINSPIARLAIRISDSIRRCDALTFVRHSAKIEQLRVKHGLAAVDRMGLVDPRSGLIVTNVARFPLPPIDFGSGKFVREYTPTNYAGTGVIVSEGSGIKVRLSYPR